MALEVDLLCHLDFTRRINLTLDVPETARIESRSKVAELRVVECVEAFHPELQPRTFAHLVQRDFLEQGESRVVGSRQAYVRLHTWSSADGPVGRNREHIRGVGEVAVCEPFRLGVDLQHTRLVGYPAPVIVDGLSAAEAEVDVLAIVKAPEAVGLPATQEGVYDGIPTRAQHLAFCEGEAIEIAE